jgi:hypothetical protein
MAISHESKRSKWLPFGDLSNIVPELFVGLARVTGAPLGFHYRQDVTTRIVQAVIRDAVPWLGVIPIYRNLKSNLGAIVEPPASRPQLRIEMQGARLGFVETLEIHDKFPLNNTSHIYILI